MLTPIITFPFPLSFVVRSSFFILLIRSTEGWKKEDPRTDLRSTTKGRSSGTLGWILGRKFTDHSLRRQPTASRHSSSTLDHESELRSGVLVGWSTVGLRPTTNQDRLVRSKIWSKVVDEWGRGEVLQLWWNRFSHEIKSHIFSELNLLIFDLRSPVAVWVYWRPHINRWPKVKISSEKIPWEGEFTFRSDPWAGLIASWGSFYPMTHHNGLPP